MSPTDDVLASLRKKWPSTLPLVSGPLSQDAPTPTAKHAAVGLILLPAPPAQPSPIILIRRSQKVTTHKGQIAFPGGLAETQDDGILATVKREVFEEIGLAPQSLHCHGYFPPIKGLLGLTVYCVLLTAGATVPEFRLCPDEVDAVILAPWDDFTASKSRAPDIFGGSYMTTGNTHVWGLTAKMLAQADLRPVAGE